MNYLCKNTDGELFVKYSKKDLTKYIGTSTILNNGSYSYTVLQVIEIY
jgi:hypothetical protein